MSELLAKARANRALPEPRTRRALREAAGLTQDECARALGVRPPTVCRWEQGARTPRGQLRDRYVELLHALKAVQ